MRTAASATAKLMSKGLPRHISRSVDDDNVSNSTPTLPFLEAWYRHSMVEQTASEINSKQCLMRRNQHLPPDPHSDTLASLPGLVLEYVKPIFDVVELNCLFSARFFRE